MPECPRVLGSEGEADENNQRCRQWDEKRRRFWTIHEPAHASSSSGTARPVRRRPRRNNQRPSNQAPSHGISPDALDSGGARKRLAWSSETRPQTRERFHVFIHLNHANNNVAPRSSRGCCRWIGAVSQFVTEGRKHSWLGGVDRQDWIPGRISGRSVPGFSVWSSSTINNQQQPETSLGLDSKTWTHHATWTAPLGEKGNKSPAHKPLEVDTARLAMAL